MWDFENVRGNIRILISSLKKLFEVLIYCHFSLQQVAISREGELLTKERLCCGLNIFKMFILKLKESLAADTIWTGGIPPNGASFFLK